MLDAGRLDASLVGLYAGFDLDSVSYLELHGTATSGLKVTKCVDMPSKSMLLAASAQATRTYRVVNNPLDGHQYPQLRRHCDSVLKAPV